MLSGRFLAVIGICLIYQCTLTKLSNFDKFMILALMKNKEELEKKTGIKKFDICLMNPPYSQRHNNNPIHFKFVEKVLGIAEKQIVIMPSRILHTTSENYNIWKEKFDKTLLSAEELKSDVFEGTLYVALFIFTLDEPPSNQTPFTP